MKINKICIPLLTLLFAASCEKPNMHYFALEDHSHPEYSENTHIHSTQQYTTYDITVLFIAKKNEAYIYSTLPLPSDVNSENSQILVQFDFEGLGYSYLPLAFQGESFFYTISGSNITFFISPTGRELMTRTGNVTFNARLIVFPKNIDSTTESVPKEENN